MCNCHLTKHNIGEKHKVPKNLNILFDDNRLKLRKYNKLVHPT